MICQILPDDHSVANLATLSLDLATFQTPLATFFFKAPSDKSSDFWKNLSNSPNVTSTVLRARDLELHLSPCLIWSVSAGSGWEEQHIQWPHGSWHRCQWAAHVHTVSPRTNHLPASPLFEIKLLIYWATSERLYVIVLTSLRMRSSASMRCFLHS